MEKSVASFAAVEGSMTTADGQTFMLHVRRHDGTDLMLAFPHAQIENIVENCAMQLAHGRDEKGLKLTSAFKTTSFELGRAPGGQSILTLVVGSAGRISFILIPEMVAQMVTSLARLLPKH